VIDRSLLLEALDTARGQRAALVRGDFDAFAAVMPRQLHACAALAEVGISDDEEAQVVDEVVDAIRESQAMLNAMMGEVTLRLGHLRVARTVAGAYLNSPPRSPLRTQDA
jgi:hypothetical protein